MLAGSEKAQVSSSIGGCTTKHEKYAIDLYQQPFTIFDTAGLNEPAKTGTVPHEQAVKDLYSLLFDLAGNPLSPSSGLHLLLFCVQGGRQLGTGQQDDNGLKRHRENWLLFCRFVARSKVPAILVITHTETECGDMMDWWRRNKVYFDRAGILPQETVCVAASFEGSPAKYEISKQRLTRAILRHSLQLEKPFKYGASVEELLVDVVRKAFVRILRFFTFKESKIAQDLLKQLDVKGEKELGGMSKQIIIHLAKQLEQAKVVL